MVSRFLAPLTALLLASCHQDFKFEIVGHETVAYNGEYSFPSELSYLEPEQSEQVVRFDVLSGDDLSALEDRLDLNGYFVTIRECSTTEENETQNGYSGLAVLSKPYRGAPEQWAFFITRRYMQQVLFELPGIALAAEEQNYCFQVTGGSMAGASAVSQEVQLGDSAMKDMLSLVGK